MQVMTRSRMEWVSNKEETMEKKVWEKPEVDESETGLEVTAYMPADLDREI